MTVEDCVSIFRSHNILGATLDYKREVGRLDEDSKGIVKKLQELAAWGQKHKDSEPQRLSKYKYATPSEGEKNLKDTYSFN